MLKRLSVADPMIPFHNAHRQNQASRTPLPKRDPVLERIDVETALDFLFADGPMERPLPRNRLEKLSDWYNDVVASRFRRDD